MQVRKKGEEGVKGGREVSTSRFVVCDLENKTSHGGSYIPQITSLYEWSILCPIVEVALRVVHGVPH